METAREQFEKEAAALVQLVRDMISAGQVLEAGQLLNQYALLNPADAQIAELRGIIDGKQTDDDGGSPACPAAGQGDSAQVSSGRPDFLKHTESIFILTNIMMKRSGFFTSIYNKIRLMEERLGYNSTILTYRHDIDLRKTEVWLKTFTGSSEVMSPATKILNVYEYFQQSYAQGLENKAVYAGPAADDALRYEKTSDSSYDVYDGDARVRNDIYSGYSGSLRMRRYFNGDKVIKEVYFDDWGYLNNIREYDPDDETVYVRKHYTTGGQHCIDALFDTKIDDLEPKEIILYDENGNAAARFGSDVELAAYYLSITPGSAGQSGEDKFYLLTFETGKVAALSQWLGKDLRNVAKVSVIHSIFLNNAYKPSSGPQPFYTFVCNNPGMMDGIVFLTKEAQRDFTDMYGHHKKTFVIPHPYPHDISRVDFEERDPRKAVVVSRLFPEKQINVTIDIFSAVVKALPDVKLEIYGIGPDREEIEAYIKKLGMENNVFLMGYTDDAVAEYKKAALSIMTSIAEGFGLTLMESICNGCPAFSFDIKYGPSDIIKDGKTGFLFKLNDRVRFAQKIIEYFENPRMQREMSGNCYADAASFSREDFLEKWTGMMETLYKRKRL